MQVSTASNSELIAFFNANTGGNPVKKFADRKTAERRVQALINEMIADGDLPLAVVTQSAHPDSIDAAYREIATREAEGEEMTGATVDPVTTAIIKPAASRLMHEYGTEVCPHCGIDLHNGVGEHMQEVNGTHIKHDKFQFACLGCGEEFGPAISKKSTVNAVGPRPAMAASMKLDRQILEVTTNTVYKNAFQVYKAGLVTSGQCDRLSGVLYTAAKQGNRLMSLNIGAYVFTLAVK